MKKTIKVKTKIKKADKVKSNYIHFGYDVVSEDVCGKKVKLVFKYQKPVSKKELKKITKQYRTVTKGVGGLIFTAIIGGGGLFAYFKFIKPTFDWAIFELCGSIFFLGMCFAHLVVFIVNQINRDSLICDLFEAGDQASGRIKSLPDKVNFAKTSNKSYLLKKNFKK